MLEYFFLYTIEGGNVMDKNFISLRIIELLDSHSITECKLSSALGRSESYINKIVSKKSLPSMESFLNICELLQITPSDFFDPDLPVKNQELMQLIHLLREFSEEDIHLMLNIANRFSEKSSKVNYNKSFQLSKAPQKK